MSEPTESHFLTLTSSDGDDDDDDDDPSKQDHRNIASNRDDVMNDGIDDDEEDEEQSTFSVVVGGGGDGMIRYDPAKGIKEPSANDVVCGRGRSSIEHPANLRFRDLINQHKERYQKAKRRDEKTKITFELVDRLRQNGRFVLFDPQTQLWYEVSEEYAREKVSHSLRSRPMEHRRNRPKMKTKSVRPPKHSPALDDMVQRILQDQQSILRTMMQKESNRMAAEAIMRATLGQPSV